MTKKVVAILSTITAILLTYLVVFSGTFSTMIISDTTFVTALILVGYFVATGLALYYYFIVRAETKTSG